MARVCTKIEVGRPAEQVFDHVTTPANWPGWHPSSIRVSGATDHSLEVGEEVTEEFLVAGRHGQVTWRVCERQAPRRWSIEGRVVGGGGGTVTYTLTPNGESTTFEREFVYAMPNPLLALLDLLVLRRRIVGESAEASRRLKAALE